eukprot:1093245-Pleurochrysis_carterae.AAC.1
MEARERRSEDKARGDGTRRKAEGTGGEEEGRQEDKVVRRTKGKSEMLKGARKESERWREGRAEKRE